MTTFYESSGCPKCKSKLYDNRLTKTNPKAPDLKCSNKACDWVRWPEDKPKGNIAATVQQQAKQVLDLEPYDGGLPGKHDGPPSKLQPSGSGAHKGDPDWMETLWHLYAACFAEAASYSTDPKIQPLIANSLFGAASNRNRVPSTER